VFSIPLAPAIHMRSLIAMSTVVVLAMAIVPGRTAAGRVLGAVLVLRLAFHYSLVCQDYFEAQRLETTAYLTAMQKLFSGYPMAYAALALDGAMDPAKPEARRFNDASLMHPIMVSLGVPEILDCRVPGRCDKLGAESVPLSVQPFAGGQLELTVNAAKVGIVRYRE